MVRTDRKANPPFPSLGHVAQTSAEVSIADVANVEVTSLITQRLCQVIRKLIMVDLGAAREPSDL